MSIHADAPPAVVSDPSGSQYATGPQLGKGGFAICHRAELLQQNKPTGDIIALKIVKSKMEPPKLAQKFVTELQIHSKISHPNIVEFYRAFSFELSTYVVLELCENGSLADAIKKRKYFTMPEIRRFMIQTCGAIKYLHHRNIVHRDLKTGNLFLDKDMNIKVGDFGLAALLISQNDLGGRRTTMCGTPNYLAPEVLEKSGRGHNEKVDLWAIGIMMYTLAVGRAPFHAPKREDIYKKLRNREYSWPELSKFPNDISEDLRDLVGSLLVHEDDRPNPDQIVSHAFFRISFIPLQLDPACTSRIPKWSKIRPPTAATIKRGYSDDWYKLCKASGVGEYEPGKTFTVFGGRKVRSVVKDCQREIDLGKQPVIPFPKEIVYRPFPERTQWPAPASGGLSEIAEEKESSSEGHALVETTGNDRTKAPPSRLPVREEQTQPLKENVEPVQKTETARRVIEKPTRMRPVRKISNPDRVTAGTAPIRGPRYTRTMQRAVSTKEIVQSGEKLPQEKEREIPEAVISDHAKPRSSPEAQSSPQVDLQPAVPHNSIIPFTDPASVLARASKFRDNVARALANRPTASRRPGPPQQVPFVSKWVDYSRKHGVGYVLEDGSIGCIVNATARHPVIHAVVRDGYTLLKEVAKDPKLVEKIPLEYYADCAGDGLRRIEVDKERRRSTSIIWMKFGKYMCQQLGQVEGRTPAEKEPSQTSFVRFYQRLGNVGVWGFGDGSFQFNFPDHTKLVFSADAEYCVFTCLSLEAAEHLVEHSDLPFKYIRSREILKSSLRNLLYGSAEVTVAFRKMTEANLLRQKLEFIISVMDEWVTAGGLGCLSEPDSLKWEGPQLEDGKKQDWVTVGRFGGDGIKA